MSAIANSANDPEERDLLKSALAFPVVGLGASAGGLAALQVFFGQMPAKSGIAFVVVLHLSPKHESSAAEILQRHTGMSVVQVQDDVAIRADHVYIIPPGSDLEMNDGHLQLVPSGRAQGDVHTNIDLFFRTMAQVHGERGIGVVLSGTGSDGAMGLTRLKEAGGVTVAQTPGDAEYDGMPSAAIATGMVDLVLPVAEMPRRLLELWDSMRRIRMPADIAAELGAESEDPAQGAQNGETALADIMTVLRLHTRHDFKHYKRATVLRRIERRLQVNALPDLSSYGRFLREHPAESALLLQDLLISVTNFFRDREAFEALERDVMPRIFEGRREKEPVRVWVTGCATGEEAYSIAILLREQAERFAVPPDFQVFATDIDERAIATARAGVYPGAIATDVTPSRLRQCFNKEGDNYRVIKAIREKILFAAHNVLRDPPFSRLDLVCCRNLLIYLERRAQAGVLDMFRFALKPHGTLFLGVSESSDASPDAFLAIEKKHRIYRAASGLPSARSLPTLAPTPSKATAGPARHVIAERRVPSNLDIHRRSLEQLLPPSVLVDANLNILNLSDGAGRFMEHASGPPSSHLLSNVSAELRLELRTALYAAAQTRENVEVRNVRMERSGRPCSVHLSVRPFKSEDGTELALVIFEESTTVPESKAVPSTDELVRQGMAQLEHENRQLKEQFQTTIEHSETSTEELKASNEELQAINEELRSATEELETSKEELQSTNEELITVNYELKLKVEEAGLINDDLQNLVASSDIATVFVDRGLHIKRFTPHAATLFNLIASDTGRSLLDITHKLNYSQLADDAQQAFVSLRVIERPVRATDGRYFLARLLPYRTAEDKIVGAVLTFIDLTALRGAEEKVKASEERLRLAAEATRDFAIITLDENGMITAWNAGASRLFQWREEEILGKPADLIFTDEDRANGVPAAEMDTARDSGRAEDERWHKRKDGSVFYASGVMTLLHGNGEKGFAKIARDMTDSKQLALTKELLLAQEQTLRQQAQAASSLKDEFLAVMSHELKHPLNLIHVNAELLTRMPDAQRLPAVVRAGQAIQRAADSQAKIIDDLLDLSRVRTGKMALRMSELALNQIVLSIAAAARANADERGVALDLHVVELEVLVHGDQVRIEQITWNLVSNAIKFTPKGGRVTVSLDVDEATHMARIRVEDTGRGIEPDFLPNIFDMFSQEGTARGANERGLGIGLALVKDLVAEHQGQVIAESEGVGRGARFTVLMPLFERVADPLLLAAVPDSDNPLAGTRILLVDDSQETLDLFAEVLGLDDAVVDVANGGAAALQLLANNTYDVLISDLGMPTMSGYELIAAVRALKLPQQPLAIALSGYGRASDVDQAKKSGFDGHLSKPTSNESVKEMLSSLRNLRQ